MAPSSSLRNLVLRALAPEDFERIAPHLEPVQLKRGEVLARSGEPPRRIVFPENAIISLVAAPSEKKPLEIGLVGFDGFTGAHILLTVDTAPNHTVVQIEGKGLAIEPGLLVRAAEASPALRLTLLRYVQAFNVQVSYTAVANGTLNIAERLARCLLMCHDRVAGDDLLIIHEFLAMMLGVRRAGVTEALHMIEGAGALRATRGRIEIRDRQILEGIAGEIYGPAEAEYEQIFGVGPRRRTALAAL